MTLRLSNNIGVIFCSQITIDYKRISLVKSMAEKYSTDWWVEKIKELEQLSQQGSFPDIYSHKERVELTEELSGFIEYYNILFEKVKEADEEIKKIKFNIESVEKSLTKATRDVSMSNIVLENPAMMYVELKNELRDLKIKLRHEKENYWKASRKADMILMEVEMITRTLDYDRKRNLKNE